MSKNKKNDMTGLDSDPTSELELPTWRRPETPADRDDLEMDADTAGFERDSLSRAKSDDARGTAFELEQKRALVKGLEAERKSLQDIIQGQNTALAELRAEIATLREDLAASDELLADENHERQALASVHDALQADMTVLSTAQQQTDERINTLLAELKDTQDSLRARTAERDELQATLQHVSQERSDNRPQAALVTALRHEVRDLNAQLAAAERLHDVTRQTLQDAFGNAETDTRKIAELQANLDEQLSLSAEQEAALKSLETAEQELRKRLETIEADHAEEIRCVRFELTEAEQTIGQHELINQQLASDLVENRSLKESLETKLTDSEVAASNEVAMLEKQLRSVTRKFEEAQSQLGNKNEAINCLLNELAEYRSRPDAHVPVTSHPPEDTGENPGMTVNELYAEDKVSRYLTGVVDGKEIRFPLFKPRLTIGRTQSNDLQLSPNFISRQHAVIVTESGRTRIIDWGSRNGIKVNNEAVTEHFLESGDLVSVGTFEFLYEERRRQ